MTTKQTQEEKKAEELRLKKASELENKILLKLSKKRKNKK